MIKDFNNDPIEFDKVEKSVEAIQFQVAKLDLKPGQVLAIIAPEEWASDLLSHIGNLIRDWIKNRYIGVEVVIFPHGTELAVVSPSGGFIDDGI